MTSNIEKNKIYDVLIVGAGPAGLSAAIYAARYRLNTIIFGKELGGSGAVAHMIENYPGFPSIAGFELMQKMIAHAKGYNIEIINSNVKGIMQEKENFVVHSGSKQYFGKTVILALGTKRKELGAPGEKEFLGKGVGYCATCDCRFYKNKIVGVVGGSDAAVTSALLLAEYAQKVYIIVRRDKFRAEPIWVDKLKQNKKIEKIFNTNVTKISGDRKVTSIEIDKPYRDSNVLKLDGVFIEIGHVPVSVVAKQLGVKMNKNGQIMVGRDGTTNVRGCFAGGDATDASELKQVITAAAQGAIAATSAYRHLNSKNE